MGDKIFFPNSAQFDEMNKHLSSIAGVLGSRMDVSTWAGIQAAVRAGAAPTLFPIGTQFKVNHGSYGSECVYDVVAHDYFKSAYDENARTMTLMAHDAILFRRFDAPEAFYYADNGLPAGTYNFTIESTYSAWVAGTYQFTLTKPLPKGGHLCTDNNASTPMTSGQIYAYESSAYASEPIETAAIISGNAGTSLGTFGRELNHAHRVSYGSNNYKESAIRQFLNSSSNYSGDDGWWSPQTKFDRPMSEYSGFPGFLSETEEDFLNVVGKVIVPCSANNVYESPDSATKKGERYTVVDRFYLASQTEIFGTTNNPIADGSVQFPYYKSATNADRIKYSDGTADRWRTRSADLWSGMNARIVELTGALNDAHAYYTLGIAPVCTIV